MDVLGKDRRPLKDGRHILYTYVREKAMKHGFRRGDFYYYKPVHPTNYERYLTRKKYSRDDYYFVKYEDDFFRVEDDFFIKAEYLAKGFASMYSTPEEREGMVFIYTYSYQLRKRYGLWIIGDYRDSLYGKWVKQADTVPIDKITDRPLACYSRFEVVLDILDRRGDMYLVASELEDGPWETSYMNEKPMDEGWEKVGNRWQKWLPGEVLYIYGEEEIPPRL